jgi:RHS repeat-associated protein
MAWMQYPGGNAGQAGEKLTYSYHPQGALKTVWSDLGSATVTADAGGGSATMQLYKAWGEVRTGSLNALATRYTFTGQAVEDSIGLMFYRARWYDPLLGRFISADTIVPNAYDPLAHDRYAYVRSNPLRYVDPSGHNWRCGPDGIFCDNNKLNDYIYNPLVMKLPSELSLSEQGIDFIRLQEHLYLNPYNDGLNPIDPLFYNRTGSGTGNCTVGYGHKIHDKPCDGRSEEDEFLNISPQEAGNRLKLDIESADAMVKTYITAPLTQYQYDALVSLYFNWGYHSEYPDKINLINAGKYKEAGLHFLIGPITSGDVIMPGLVKRRYAEAVMFLTGYNIQLPTLEEYIMDPQNVNLIP